MKPVPTPIPKTLFLLHCLAARQHTSFFVAGFFVFGNNDDKASTNADNPQPFYALSCNKTKCILFCGTLTFLVFGNDDEASTNANADNLVFLHLLITR